jgi:phospholipid transport system substrate-binding protein
MLLFAQSIKTPRTPAMMNRRTLTQSAAALAAAAWLGWAPAALAADEAPDALIKRLSSDVLETVKGDKSI